LKAEKEVKTVVPQGFPAFEIAITQWGDLQMENFVL